MRNRESTLNLSCRDHNAWPHLQRLLTGTFAPAFDPRLELAYGCTIPAMNGSLAHIGLF
jgi:hypothetical protein